MIIDMNTHAGHNLHRAGLASVRPGGAEPAIVPGACRQVLGACRQAIQSCPTRYEAGPWRPNAVRA